MSSDPNLPDATSCDGNTCEICCIVVDSVSQCLSTSEESYACQIDASDDFSIVWILLIVLGALLIGVPICLFILDLLMLKRPPFCGASFCEFMANRICSCICLSKKYRKSAGKNNKDVLSLLSLPGKKVKKDKIAPEGMGAAQNAMPDP